ncbi:hypothetical protein Tco_0116744 [Tanacetum coccineum]
MGDRSFALGPSIGVSVKKLSGLTDSATVCAKMDTIRLRWGSKSLGVNARLLSLEVNVPRSLPWRESFDSKGKRFDLTKSDLCPSFVKDLTAKGVSLRVADSHTGNHHKDGFTPLETIQRFIDANNFLHGFRHYLILYGLCVCIVGSEGYAYLVLDMFMDRRGTPTKCDVYLDQRSKSKGEHSEVKDVKMHG